MYRKKQEDLSVSAIDNDMKSCFEPMKKTFLICLVSCWSMFFLDRNATKEQIFWGRLTKYICYKNLLKMFVIITPFSKSYTCKCVTL